MTRSRALRGAWLRRRVRSRCTHQLAASAEGALRDIHSRHDAASLCLEDKRASEHSKLKFHEKSEKNEGVLAQLSGGEGRMRPSACAPGEREQLHARALSTRRAHAAPHLHSKGLRARASRQCAGSDQDGRQQQVRRARAHLRAQHGAEALGELHL
eukprot:6182834-Pleurochrysis_carterae.AAC.2